MKITIPNAELTLDIDPEDLSPEALRACIAEADARGIGVVTAGHAPELQLTIERACTSLLNGNVQLALGQLALHVSPEVQRQRLRGASGAMIHNQRALRAEMNGGEPSRSMPAVEQPATPQEWPKDGRDPGFIPMSGGQDITRRPAGGRDITQRPFPPRQRERADGWKT